MIFLDLFCGAGGAAMGLHRAFPDALIVGIDNRLQKHYPFNFIQGDALNPPVDLAQFDFIWASPPCQHYSAMQHIKKNKDKHPDLVAPIRKILQSTRKPYIIENVEGAPIRNDLMLCGSMFKLGMIRHRIFESNKPIFSLMPPCDHSNMYDPWHYGVKQLENMSTGMGIDWMKKREEVREAIPPAYSEYLIKQIFPNGKS